MDDITSKINDLLSDPAAMQQLNSLAASLGLGNAAPDTAPSPGQANNTQNNPLQGLDMNMLSQLLGGLGGSGDGNNIQPPDASSGAGGLDTAKLASLLSGLGGSGGGGGLGALSGLLGGGGSGLGALSGLLGGGSGGLGALSGLLGGGSGGGGGIDGDALKTVAKIMPLLSTFRQEDNNTRLLHALRPLLGPERQKKLDESVKMLSMLRLLPLLKEQGIL